MMVQWTTFPKVTGPQLAKLRMQLFGKPRLAGVWIFGCGLLRQQATIVGTDGTPTLGPFPETKAVVVGFRSLRSRLARRR